MEVGEAIKESLGWRAGELSSFWANSHYLNICFMGQTFYQIKANQCGNTAFVRHFTEPTKSMSRNSFGVSFGNSGSPERLAFIIQCLLSLKEKKLPVQVFAGRRRGLYYNLDRHFGKFISLHEWVNFSDYFPSLRGVAFLGGVGTIWECVNHGVPMLVVPSITGDQMINGLAVNRLGMGELITLDDVNHPDVVFDKLGRIIKNKSYEENIEEFKKDCHYTDTLETLHSKFDNL